MSAHPPPQDGAAKGGAKGTVPVVLHGGRAAKVVDPAAPLAQPAAAPPVRPTATQSRWRPRHAAIVLSFAALVLLPVLLTAGYLWTRAADQYASIVGFSVRTEESASSINSLLGPLDLGGQTPDADILYEFIQSQNLVTAIDAKLDLRRMWSKPGPEADPVFAYHPPGTIEDLHSYWSRMVHVSFDGGAGLLELRVQAFAPEDAQAIAEEITAQSSALINGLSIQAREDAIGYARDELSAAVERLKDARRAVTEFRNRTQIVDPTIDVQGQAGLLAQLNTQLAGALIDLDMLQSTTRAGDPRLDQAERRIAVIEARIEGEKKKLGIGEAGSEEAEAFATLVGEYESLVVDREFAEQTYTTALAAYDAAQAEARRQSRYLAVHQRPTLAERADYPRRLVLLALVTLFSFLAWSILTLIVYSLRDRR